MPYDSPGAHFSDAKDIGKNHAVSLKADRTTAHDRTVRRPRLHAVNSCAVVLVVRHANNRLACSRQDLGNYHCTRTEVPCQGRLVLVNTRRPCPCLLDRGTTAVSRRRLVSVVACSTQNEANSNLLLMFFSCLLPTSTD